ncbi:DUF4301 family protein [Flavobacterium sp. CS20]|nr:DUF4301 family protein [Flavobacterium sp. CS20]QTY26024.1 DUF4301 family protein [Flavobacterium sp. CS20]
MQLSPSDKKQLESKGISEAELSNQLKTFEIGIPFVKILDYAQLGKGIKKLSDEDKKHYKNTYETSQVEVVKFIPASGADQECFAFCINFLMKLKLKTKK